MNRLEEVVPDAPKGQIKTVVVMDADKTLAPHDASTIFWRGLSRDKIGVEGPLKDLFSGPRGYSYYTFWQATLLYEEEANDEKFYNLCREVASEVKIYSEFLIMLWEAAKRDDICAVVVTCGLPSIWEMVLDREGLSETVKVIGGGRISNGFVVTPEIKAAFVQLQTRLKARVCAFGDSPLDLPMLMRANQAVIVVGDEKPRSHKMESCLKDAIEIHGLVARQVLLPDTVTPRLDTILLPLLKLSCREIYSLLSDSGFSLFHATHKNAAKVLSTRMRDASLAGLNLREAHQRIRRYLAVEFISNAICLECYGIR